MLPQIEAIAEKDIVLVHSNNQPYFFARVERITPDPKQGWWQVEFFVLAVPLQVVTWTIDDAQIRGANFTMSGIPMRIEKVSPPSKAQTTANVETKLSPNKAVDMLVNLYDKSPNGEGFVTVSREAEPVREIGKELDELGGFKLMQEVHALFAQIRPRAARNLEMVWNGIGGWLG